MATALAAGLAAVTGLSATTASLITTTALYAGTFYAQYMLSQAMAPKEKSGTKLQFQFGGDVAQSFIVGTTETAGSLVYVGSHGKVGSTPNAFLVQVFCLSDLPSTELLARIWINGEKDEIDFAAGERTMNGNPIGYPVKGRRKGSDDKMFVRFLDGTQTVADAYLRDKFNGAKNPWKASMVGRGRTLVIVTTKYDKKEPDGIPQCRFVVKGIKVYNPKKDTTNGGSGTMRWNNQNTWEWDENPGCINYTLARGVYYDGEWIYGGRNWPAYALDNDSFFTGINTANDNISLKGGGTEKRYEVGGEISLNASIFETFDEINAACNGRMAESGGKLFFDCGSYGAAEFVFNDGELFTNNQLDNTVQPSMAGTFNTVVATYTEPGIGGEQKAIKPKTKQAYIDADGGIIRRATPTLRFCRNNRQAQRVSQAMLNDNRRVVTRQVVLGPERRDGMRANLVLAWDSERYQYDQKTWIIGDHMLYPNGGMLVELREKNPADDSWDPMDDEDDFIVGEWESIVPDADVKAITVEQWPIKNSAGDFKGSGLRINWTIDEEDVDMKRMRYQARLLDSTDIAAEGTADFEQGFAIIKGLAKNEPYQVRAIAVPLSDFRDVEWTEWDDTTVYPGGDDHIVAPNGSDIDDSAPADLAVVPTIELRTRVHRSNQVRQRLIVNLDTTGRPANESYRIRWVDTTEDPDETDHAATGAFPKSFVVQSGHSYVVRVAPVSQFGVVGNYSAPAVGVTMPIAKYSGNVPAISGLAIEPGMRRNALEWDGVDLDAYPDYAFTEIQKDNTPSFTSPLIRRITGTTWVDARLQNSDTKFYRVRHVDTSGNPGAWSATVSGTTVRIVDDDLDDSSPSNPGSLSLSTGAADVDDDGKQEAVLLISWSPSGSIVAKSFAIEVWRSTSAGSGFALWKKITADGDDTQHYLRNVNTKYFYQARIKARGGSKNKSNGSFTGFTGSVKPTKRTFGLSVGAVSTSWSSYRRKHVIKVNNLPVENPEFAYIEIYQKTGPSTFTLVHKGRQDKVEIMNPPSNVTGYRARVIDITSNISPLNYDSPGSPTGGDGVDDIVTAEIAAEQVSAAKIGTNAVLRRQLANNIVEAQENFGGAGVNDNVIASINVDHGDGTYNADHLVVWGSFVNNEGSPRTGIDVSLERAGGITFSNQQLSLEDDGICTIFGVIGRANLSGSGNTVINLRCSGSFSKKDRRLVVVPVW